MINLRSVAEILPNTRVILRMDLDVPIVDDVIEDDSRLVKSIPTIKLLLEKKCKIAIIGHRGRPTDKEESKSLRPVYVELMMLLEPNGENLIDSIFIEDVGDREKIDQAMATNQIVFLENLRYWKGEMNNDPDFLKGLIEVCQFYVNDSIAESHRRATSIMLYKRLPGFYGLSFIEEIEKINKAINNSEKPLTVILGGAKEDKLKHLLDLINIADYVLIGGKLPKITNYELRITNKKIIWAELRENGLDLSDEDIKKFVEIIQQSKTIVWAGAMGMFESSSAKKGTEEIAKAVAEANAYKIIAGGDTGSSIRELGLENKIDYICSGGGVMLELLTKGKLPAWE